MSPFLRRCRDALLRRLTRGGSVSYAQAGEDIIVSFALKSLGLNQPYYLDIGAYHPTKLSNTYHFYRKGARGICVEPDPTSAARFVRVRPGDQILGAAIGPTDSSSETLYLMSEPALNTFSSEMVERYKTMGLTVRGTLSVPAYSLKTLIEKHCSRIPDLVSLDVEGLDEDIIANFDFAERPAVFVIETMLPDERHKNTAIAALFEKNGYFSFADTYVNTIFIDQALWEQKKHERLSH